MRYLGRIVIYALLFMLASVLFSIEVSPLYGSVAFSFLTSALLTSIMAEIVGVIVFLPLVALFYLLFGKAGTTFSTLLNLFLCYVVQFHFVQYFGEKFAWYPNFSSGEAILFLVVNFVLVLALLFSSNKN